AAMISIVSREPAAVVRDSPSSAIVETGTIGFAGAADEDRRRWLIAFRHLLDGLESPLQVVIEVTPGCGEDPQPEQSTPRSFDDMRAADLEFAEAVAVSPTAHTIRTRLVIGP